MAHATHILTALTTIGLAAALGTGCAVEADPGASERVAQVEQAYTSANPVLDYYTCMSKSDARSASHAVGCVPDGCRIDVVDSDSAQPACKVGDLLMPRVILTCDSGVTWFPSFTLCPRWGDHDRVEVAMEVVAGDDGQPLVAALDAPPEPKGGGEPTTGGQDDLRSRQRMGVELSNFSFPLMPLDAHVHKTTGVVDRVGKDRGTQGCTGCHDVVDQRDITPNHGMLVAAEPIFDGDVLATTDAALGAEPQVDDDVHTYLADLCWAMRGKRSELTAAANGDADAVSRAIALCHSLAAYTP